MRGGYHDTFNIDQKTLVELYQGYGLTCEEIGHKFGVHATTIFKKLKMYNIPRRRAGLRTRLQISREVLYDLYCIQGLGSGAIARKFKVSSSLIRNYLNKFEIPIRPQAIAASLAGKGKTPWQAGLTKETCPRLKQISEQHKGEKSHLFGKCGIEHPSFGYRHTGEWKQRMSTLRKGGHMSEESKANSSLAAKRLWANPGYRDKAVRILRQAQRKRPTGGEQQLINLFRAEELPYKYVGDGSLIVYGFNPDFVHNNGQKKIIEFFGDFWHRDRSNLKWESTEQGRKDVFAQLGFSTLVVWQHELKDMDRVLERVKQFTEV